MKSKFDQNIYETPENWGETTIANEKTMRETIDAIRLLGEDWANCELSDCDRFSLINSIDNDIALYERKNVRKNEYRLYKTVENGFYEFVYFQGIFGRRVGQIFSENEELAILEAKEFVSDMNDSQ